jgi:hypothetical protein
MKVYVLVHETYGYWANEYDVEIKSFKDKRSAINYLSIWKNEILNYYLEDVDAETVEEFRTYLGDSLYTFDIEDDDWFKIDVEDTGYDTLYIEEQDIMEFEL